MPDDARFDLFLVMIDDSISTLLVVAN
jgi:hypothetical protein